MTDHKPNDHPSRFLEHLAALDRGDLARLRRNAGRPIAEARDALGLFYRVLPLGVPPYQEETYFLLATLYPLADGGGTGDLGVLLRHARQDRNAKGLDRRVEILLDADATQLPFRLRQAVHFLHSNRVRMDWARLLANLLSWNHPERFVQKQWARSYFGEISKEGI